MPTENSRRRLPIILKRTLAMNWIGQLYEIDEGAGDDLAAKAEVRHLESRAVLDQMKT